MKAFRTMTPAQFAKQECANLLPEGDCLAATPESLLDTGQPKTATPRNHCLVAQGKPCDYFERLILPLADEPSPHDDPTLQARRASARQTYLGAHARAASKNHPQRRCPECGRPRPARHRFCDSCNREHRRKAYRLARTRKACAARNS